MVKATTNSKKDSFGIYLKDIGKYDILTKEQEIELARSVQAMINLLSVGEGCTSLEDKIAACGCTKKEYERIIYKGSKAKQLMILHNLKLVVSIAKKYSSRGVDIEDLVQEGNIGLNRAVEKFNPELGYKLSTYACVPTTTLILTQRGWIKWDKIKGDDKTLGYDVETQTLRWTQIEKVTQYKSAPLLRFGNKEWSTVCTPNHKWVMKDKEDNNKLKPIEMWADKEHSLVLCAPYCEGESDIEVDTAIKMAKLYMPLNRKFGAMHVRDEDITVLILGLKPKARRAFIDTWFEEGGRMTPALELSIFLEGDNTQGDKITNKNAYVLEEKEGEVWCPSTGLESWVAKDEKGNIFITGNTWWIKQAIARAVATHSRSIRLPVHIYDLLNKMKRTARELSQKEGRQATLQEIAKHLDIDYDKLRKLSLFTKNVLSFDASYVDSENSTVLNEYSNYIVGAEVRETHNEVKNKIMYILNQLTERERRIVILRYGLESDKPYTYKDISIDMGLSIPTVRTICNNLKSKFKELGELDPQDFPDYHIELTTDSFMLS